MGAEGLEPSRLLRSTDFHSPVALATASWWNLKALRIGPSLYPRLNVRVAPVGPLHLPNHRFRLGSGLPCLLPDLGFPEFESSHLTGFSVKAQFSKSVASAIPPCPQRFLWRV